MYCSSCGVRFETAAVFCHDCGHLKETLAEDRFRVAGVVARGASGIGLRAHDDVLDREVFIKVFPSVVVGEEAEVRFPAASGELSNVVQALAYTAEIAPAALISEWIDGPSLNVIAQRRQLSVPMALATVDGAAAGLHQVHLAGWAHGFLTPSRVLVNMDAEVRIADVGQPATVDAEDFVAPELRAGDTAPSRAADVYSAGRLLEFAVAAATAAGIGGHFDGAVDGVALRADVARLVDAACADDPDDRIRSAVQFRNQLREIADRHVDGWAAAGGAALGGVASKLGPVALISSGGEFSAVTSSLAAATAASPAAPAATVSATATGASTTAMAPMTPTPDIQPVSAASSGSLGANGTAAASPGAASAVPAASAAGGAGPSAATSGFLGSLTAHPIIAGAAAAVLVGGLATGGLYAYSEFIAPDTAVVSATDVTSNGDSSVPAQDEAAAPAAVEAPAADGGSAPDSVPESGAGAAAPEPAAPAAPAPVAPADPAPAARSPIPEGMTYVMDRDTRKSLGFFARSGGEVCIARAPSDGSGGWGPLTTLRLGIRETAPGSLEIDGYSINGPATVTALPEGGFSLSFQGPHNMLTMNNYPISRPEMIAMTGEAALIAAQSECGI